MGSSTVGRLRFPVKKEVGGSNPSCPANLMDIKEATLQAIENIKRGVGEPHSIILSQETMIKLLMTFNNKTREEATKIVEQMIKQEMSKVD